MSSISKKDKSWSFDSEKWTNEGNNEPHSAVYAVHMKEELHKGMHQNSGVACCVVLKVDGHQVVYFVTSSDLETDKKQVDLLPCIAQKTEGCQLVVDSAVKFGPFAFLSFDRNSSLGLKGNPLTCLDFQVPKQNLKSEFEARTFVGTKKLLKLKFEYQGDTGKYSFSAKKKDHLEQSFVLGAPIIIKNKDVTDKHSSSRWPVVGVMGLDEDLKFFPYFVTADIFDSKPVQTTSGDVEQLVSGIQLDTNGGGGSMSEMPLKIALQPQSQTKKEGSRVELRCEVTGSELSYCWLKDGQEMEGQRDYCLVFEQVSMADFGSYVCQVKKKGQFQRCSSEVAELDVAPCDGKSYTLLRNLPLDVEEMVGKKLSLDLGGKKAWKFLADHYKMERTDIYLLEKERLPGVDTINYIKTVAPNITVYNFCKTLKQHNIRRLDIVQGLEGHLSS